MQKLRHFAEASALTEALVFGRRFGQKFGRRFNSAEAAKSRVGGTLVQSQNLQGEKIAMEIGIENYNFSSISLISRHEQHLQGRKRPRLTPSARGRTCRSVRQRLGGSSCALEVKVGRRSIKYQKFSQDLRQQESLILGIFDWLQLIRRLTTSEHHNKPFVNQGFLLAQVRTNPAGPTNL